MSAILSAHKALARQSYRSGAINIASRNYRGDPGILGSIWSGIKGAVGGFVTGGPAGAILGGAAGLVSGNKGKPVNPAAGTVGTLYSSILNKRALVQPADINIGSPHPTINIGTQPPPMMAGPGRGNTTQGGTVADWNDRPNSLSAACPKGYHANKSGYYSQKYGWVPAGSACVKNRRRNPLNPRALSRAMSRLSSAKNAARFLSQVSIRGKGCGCHK